MMNENNEIFSMFDEDGIERVAKIITEVEVDGQDYIVYALEVENEQDKIYVSKMVGEEIVDIVDPNERQIVNKSVIDLLNDMSVNK